MRILKLLLVFFACLGGGQVMAETPWPGIDTSGAMTLAGGSHFKGHHRHSHGFMKHHHHGFKFHSHGFKRGFIGHSHRFHHKHHRIFVVEDPRFVRHHHSHRVHSIHDRSDGIVIRFHDSRSRMFKGSDF
ncbi:hypothetical protein [Pseudomonas sp. BN102]|uniref:hypothetical protein n=1 Tax=Pseudomonas sp. BN102 TaxID=2567886 RepID=UPI00245634BE|nr:hypothetical protein [Pseudomonas sp. BN102]MDH4608862.1 hypothetical protein [Pseudomonas sp. BN102]